MAQNFFKVKKGLTLENYTDLASLQGVSSPQAGDIACAGGKFYGYNGSAWGGMGGGSATISASTGIVDANSGTSFSDTRTGNRTIAVHNLGDGQSVAILVSGAANNVITITAYSDAGVTSVPVKYGAGQSGTMASAYSLFTIYRIGSSFCVVGPIHGVA
jgi:hypothetical protein